VKEPLVKIWTFDLVADRPTTAEEENAFDWCDALADGDIGYGTGGGLPTTFRCDIDADSLADAITEATRRIHLAIPGLNVSLDPEGDSPDCCKA
jgi:hypothetical protein